MSMAPVTVRGLWDGKKLTPVTIRGYWDGTTLWPITQRGLQSDAVPTQPPPPPATASPMLYGVSATDTSQGFAAGFNAQVAAIHAKIGYFYGQNTLYSQISGVPSNVPLLVQTKSFDPASHAATIASFPTTRQAPIFFHVDNEVDRKVSQGVYTMAAWQAACDSLFGLIADSGKNYLVPSVQVQYYALQQMQKATHVVGVSGGAYDLANYVRPGLRYWNWSAYAGKRIDSTGLHEEATTDTVKMPNTIKAFMATSTMQGIKWGVTSGWAVDDAFLSDPVTLQRRANWFLDASANLASAGAADFDWFDIDWANGDYRIETDPNYLLPAWTTRLKAVGQW